ncbi:MAG: tetratricopeptide repeat protein [candidate division KSB1 bacterium]|nr:tetratricopeptide repeat protein [candidate division KSB1 bacterium]MDZ7275949.1 tetratricopeptide repeat protein [candidate division KSB1 bacterium]MDZ7285769.1 tetratricopeptide repeat protein [candidate division KSB1 bacterium]MDZ7298801.1 tetratricopeptide repeat protein [candidate division KSB1 bacterium]MDZ7308853.1 tetratricopeptide repeat protein [candidate division KSB1 bacterium]
MTRKWKSRLTAALGCTVLLVSAMAAHSQPTGGRWLYGFSFAAQRLTSPRRAAQLISASGTVATGRVTQAGYGPGLSARLERRVSARTGLSLSLGYATLPFRLTLQYPTYQTASALRTQMVGSELWLNYDVIPSQRFRPYLLAGAGYLNFRVSGSKRLHAGNILLGAGARWQPHAHMLWHASLVYHFQASDRLDAVVSGNHDAFLGIRVGVLFFKGGTLAVPELFTDQRRTGRTEPAMRAPVEVAPRRAPATAEHRSAATASAAPRKRAGVPSAKVSPPRPAAGGEKAKPPASATAARPTSFAGAYEQALQNIYARRYEVAVRQFTELIEIFPAHVLISNCHYWLGKAQYELQNYAAAVTACQRVMQFPKSARQDDALFILGNSLLRLQRREEARAALQRLLRDHPNSRLAPQAQELLAKM